MRYAIYLKNKNVKINIYVTYFKKILKHMKNIFELYFETENLIFFIIIWEILLINFNCYKYASFRIMYIYKCIFIPLLMVEFIYYLYQLKILFLF